MSEVAKVIVAVFAVLFTLGTALGILYGIFGSFIPFWVEFGIENPTLTGVILVVIVAFFGKAGFELVS